MKLKYTFLTGILAAAALASCVSENNDSEPATATGKMAVTVAMSEPQATRANTQVYDFPVIVKNAQGDIVKSYDRADAIPSTVLLPVGNYTVESHTPGEIAKRMTTPYYAGTADMEIQKDIITNVEVVCKMLNSNIQLKYNADFLSLFASWSITIDDGSETALSFSNADGSEPTSVYWYFENMTETLTLQFNGVTTAGKTVSATRSLSKTDPAVEGHYDDDRINFTGGDLIVINFAPVENTEGTVTDITINADVTFTETNTTVPVEVTNAALTPGTEDPGTPGGDDPTPGEDAITLTLPAPVTLSADESATADPSTGDVTMTATKGLKSVSVKVISSSEEMMEQLAAVADEYAGVDLVNGCEVVGNNNLVAFLAGLDKVITVPAEGDTEYTFPVGQFYLFLGILPGVHDFVMTVTDMDGNKKTGTVKVTITE